MSEVISPIPQNSLGGKSGKKSKNKTSQKQSPQQKEPLLDKAPPKKEPHLEQALPQKEPQLEQEPPQKEPQLEQPPPLQQLEEASPAQDVAGTAAASKVEKLPGEAVGDTAKSISKADETATITQENGSGDSDPKPADTEADQVKPAEGVEQNAEEGEVPPSRTTAEELVLLSEEKATLEKQRLADKDIRGLNKILTQCKDSAQGIKGDVLKVLQERRSCEDECLEIERNIGEKLAALKAEVHKSTKECIESMTEEVEPETRTPIPVPSGPSLGAASGRERRASSKSATPPPSGLTGQDKERALLDRISDLSKQEPPKKLSASSKKKAVESVLRSLGDFETTEDKLRALCELHYETLEQLRETQTTTDKWRKQFQASQKENNRSLLARDRLEGLCRELQKHNNAIKEESALRRREEEEKRKHIAAKFQATLTDISTLMADTQETSAKLRQDNAQLASKLRTLVNHYDLWEKHSENMLKQKTIETELAMAKLREAQLLREKDVTEVEHSRKLLETATKEMQCQLEASLRNEILLREQLKLHNDKYEEFQEAIVSSNKMFTDFKGEVESMGKQTRKFEKDALQWKQRWEEANLATARVFQEKTKSDLKVETLSRLCRSLQDKLRITNQDMADLESSVAGEVVAEEKVKLEQELTRKQREIQQHKEALEVRQKEVQAKMAEHVGLADKVSTEMEQALDAAQTSLAENAEGADTPSEESQAQQTVAGPSSSKRDGKKKNKKKH